MKKRTKKILIIGGLGFIGKNLYINCKKAGYYVQIFSNIHLDKTDPFSLDADPHDIIIGDMNNPSDLKVIRNYDVVYSLAGLSGAAASFHDPYNDVKINLIGHLNILEACRLHNPEVVLLFPSSRLVYGKPSYIPVDEKHPLDPESIYSVHKLTAEYYYGLYYKIYQIRTIIFRISNPYGPYQLFGEKKYGILNWFIFNALNGSELELFGDGSQERDYIYIDDLIDLMIAAPENSSLYGGIFNVGSGQGITIHDAIEAVKNVIPGLKYKYTEWPEIEKKIETGNYISNIDKISMLTGWKPTRTFSAGMKKTVEYYQHHFSG